MSFLRLAASLAASWVVLWGAQSGDPRTKFEVASIRRDASGCAGGRGSPPSPGRLRAACIAVKDLIQAAYGTFADGSQPDARLLRVVGAPEWVETETFDIDAKPEGEASIGQIYGPMLQRLLEERFSLRIHRETRELPVCVLSVGSGGPRLTATKPGTCARFDPAKPPAQAPRDQPSVAPCGRTSIRRSGAELILDAYGVTMASFAGVTLTARANLDRPVIDRTRLQGMFDVHLAFAADLAAAQRTIDAGDDGPSIFTAVRDLGLKLAPDRGPVEVLVVDGISRPAEN